MDSDSISDTRNSLLEMGSEKMSWETKKSIKDFSEKTLYLVKYILPITITVNMFLIFFNIRIFTVYLITTTLLFLAVYAILANVIGVVYLELKTDNKLTHGKVSK